MKLLRIGKGAMEEEEEDEKDEEDKGGKENAREGDKEESDNIKHDEEDSSATESDASPLLRTIGHKYALRYREAKKLSNTMETPLVLTLSPPSFPRPTPSPPPSPN
ncbi:hypothetical protein Acr_10g0006830 [Actinidia rufa]|uniref:Uncharacterized protein n=1 Tax=Actinidia rufa TaxID=165716 RepID=A0A7J0F9B6_9ERIC|nr:hypothetical protein Acr_10g0006830 [Actinidia rufa]